MGTISRHPIRRALINSPTSGWRVRCLSDGGRSAVTRATPTTVPADLMREKNGVVFSLTHRLSAQNLRVKLAMNRGKILEFRALLSTHMDSQPVYLLARGMEKPGSIPSLVQEWNRNRARDSMTTATPIIAQNLEFGEECRRVER